MKSPRALGAEVIVIAVVAAAAMWLRPGSNQPADGPMQLAQEVYGSPIGEYNGPIGGPMAYGEPVGNGPIGGPMAYGEPVGNGPIGGPMLYGEPVGNGPVGGPSMFSAPVGDDAPIGGDTLY
jgi:hypothetical protein